jgi:hypothetical protein
MVLLSGCALGIADPIPPAPGLRGADVAGNDGPCGTVRHRVYNAAQWELPTYVFEPTGDGECSADERPVIFFGHGYIASFTEAYTRLLEHLVSRGFVVVYPGYSVEFDPPKQYAAEDAGFVAGIASLPAGRVDLSRIGFVGHSFGAGMVPRMMQLASGRGWGSDVMWAVQMSPAWEFEVGDGPIVLPEHARVLSISYDKDVFVDTQVATEGIEAMTIPASQKQQLIIHGPGSDHLLPLTLPVPGSVDGYDRWATWRPIDAWSGCALDGRWCDIAGSDLLADMGPDLPRATIGAPVRDVGPPAIVECESLVSPRGCW